MANYVKFMRGLSSVFDKLTTKDANTLYFIYESEDSVSGRLFLGDREILCDGHESAIAELKDLVDVDLPDDISELLDGQVLTYDAISGKWMAKDPSAIAEVLFDSNQFEANSNGEWSLLGFANAPNGARLTKSANGKLVWDLPEGGTYEDLAEQIEIITADIGDLTSKFNDYDTAEQVNSKISEAIAAANHLAYKTVDTKEEINVGAQDADKFIYLVKNGNIYDEYMVINGQLERVGDWNVDLSEYATKELVDTKVEDLTTALNSTNVEVETLKTSVSNINTTIENLTGLTSTVEDLSTALNGLKDKVDAQAETIDTHTTQIAELQSALEQKVDTEDFEELKTAMSWKTLTLNEE